MVDRTAQRKALTDQIQPCFAAQDAMDAADDKEAGDITSQNTDQQAYANAMHAFLNGTGTGAAVDAARAALTASSTAQPIDFQASLDKRAAFNAFHDPLLTAVSNLWQQPGQIENVTGKV